MAKFQYVAKNSTGREEKGTITANNEEDATGKLRQKGLSITTLSKVKEEKTAGFWAQLNQKPKKASIGELALFTRQKATMISAGIPLLEALDILADQTKETNAGFSEGLEELAGSVRGGMSLSEAMTEYPKIFPPIYINMIKAGEASGQIDTILDRLADFMEASEKLKAEIKSAMTYPVVSLLMVLAITAYLLVGVVPKFESMFASMGAELPGVTKMVLFASEWLQAKYWVVLIVAAIAFVFLKITAGTEKGATIIDTLKLKAPVFGGLNQKVSVSRFSRTFATLLASGVPILGALEIVASTAGNKVLETTLLSTRDTVRNGEDISTFLETSWVFPPMVVKMIAIGEKSGALELLLSKIADFYDAQVEVTIKSLTSLIEPFMLMIMGAIVGTIVIAIFMPILEMSGKV